MLENYDFVGWFTAQTGGTQVTADNVVYLETAHILWAHWTRASIEVTFKVDDATYDTKKETIGQKYVLPVQPSKQYKTFAGWWTEDGSKQVTENTDVTKDDATTLVAHWDDIKADIVFNANGGK